MSNRSRAAGTPNTDGVDPETFTTLRREQARIGTEWVVSGRVRLHRRIVTETRMVEVTVRREELVVSTDTDATIVGTVLEGPAATATPTPMVFVLREERPELVVRVHPYEQVTVHVEPRHSDQRIGSQVRTETVDLDVHPTI